MNEIKLRELVENLFPREIDSLDDVMEEGIPKSVRMYMNIIDNKINFLKSLMKTESEIYDMINYSNPSEVLIIQMIYCISKVENLDDIIKVTEYTQDQLNELRNFLKTDGISKEEVLNCIDSYDPTNEKIISIFRECIPKDILLEIKKEIRK